MDLDNESYESNKLKSSLLSTSANYIYIHVQQKTEWKNLVV